MKAILTYHSLDPSGSAISLDEEAFRRHVAWLAGGGPRVLGLAELVRAPADADAVALTFDDGFASFGTTAAPLLLEHGLPATVFVVTGRAGTDNAWDGEPAPGIPVLPLLGWEELGSLAGRGFTIGAHSRTHRRLTRLAPAEVEDEVAGSAEDIERRLGVRPRAFCYPYGDVDDGVAAAAARLFEMACATDLGVLGGPLDPFRLPRLDMVYFRAPGRLEAWGREGFLRYVRFRAAARRARAALGRAGLVRPW